MPITYGVQKRKTKRIPKYVTNEAFKNDHDVFELLKKDAIKTIRPVGNLRKKAKEVLKEPPKISLKGNSTFDELLNAGPVNNLNFSSSLLCPNSNSSLNDTSYEKENKCNDIIKKSEKRKRLPSSKSWKDLRHVRGGVNWIPKQKRAPAIHSFFNTTSDNGEVTHKMEDQTKETECSFYGTSDGPSKLFQGWKHCPTVCSPKSNPSSPKQQFSNYISPIVPLLPQFSLSTSTPHGKQSSLASQHLSYTSPCSENQSANLNNSVFCYDQKGVSLDLFASSDRKDTAGNLNDEAVSVDMFSSREEGSLSPVSHSQQVYPSNSIKTDDQSQELSDSVDVCNLSDSSSEHKNSSCNLSLSNGDSSSGNQDISTKVTETLRNLRISSHVGNNSSREGTISNADSCMYEVVSLNGSQEGKELNIKSLKVEELCSRSNSKNTDPVRLKECVILLKKCDVNKQTARDHISPNQLHGKPCVGNECPDSSQNSTAESETSLCMSQSSDKIQSKIFGSSLQECEVRLHKCDNTSSVTSDNFTLKCEVDLAKPPSNSTVGDQSQITSSIVDFPKPRKSSLIKNSCQEAVVLKPGKHWRRSISILAKVRSSLGETSADVRKSLVCDDSKVKGKLYESAVDSIIQMQSTINFIPEEDEVCHSSSLNEQSYEHQRIEEESVVCVEESPMCQSAWDLQCHRNWADEIFSLCSQKGPVPFHTCYPASMKKHCKKIGEGVYGEVFFYSPSSKHRSSVIKVIPIEGSMHVNGEPQKTFKEILSEVCVALELSNLREGLNNAARTFNEVQAVRCVQGSYPSWLLELWNSFNESKGSENDCPEIFQDDQLYLVLELGHGGKDLESFLFRSADQGLAAFKQIALSLAVGEKALEFEHRDLHWGNVLISETKDKDINFMLDGKSIRTQSSGIKISIIDFTLSRISDPSSGRPIFYDLSKDDTLFMSQGDYQFEVYRMMKDYCGNMWDTFSPKTNIAWLHYLCDKLCFQARYKNKVSIKHKDAINKLFEIREIILSYADVTSVVHALL